MSLRWIKLPPVWTNSRDHVREVPYMRYGHSAVLIDDTVYIWGGRNDTEGACNVLYAFDVSKFQLLTPPCHSCSSLYTPTLLPRLFSCPLVTLWRKWCHWVFQQFERWSVVAVVA